MIKRRITNRSGFSLAETLLATVILLLVSVIVANGVPAAKTAYEKVVVGANAKVLLSTTIAALRDELATARDVTVTGTTITYYSADIGASSKIYLNAAADGGDPVDPSIMLQEFIDPKPSEFGVDTAMWDTTVAPRQLVSGVATARGELYVTYNSATLAATGESITISGLSVKRGNSETFATADLTIRLIVRAPEPETEP